MISLSSYNLNKMHCLSSIIIQLISVRISSVRFWFLCGKVIANLCSLLFMKQISSHTYVYCTKRHSSFVIFILCGIENEFLGAFWMNKRIICSYKVFFYKIIHLIWTYSVCCCREIGRKTHLELLNLSLFYW